MPKKRTLRGWMEYLDDPTRELSEAEFVLVMQFNQREYLRLLLEDIHQVRLSCEHTEGMLGALDQLALTVSGISGLPYAAGSGARAALARAREDRS